MQLNEAAISQHVTVIRI